MQVGATHAGADGGEPVEGGRRRVPVVVVLASADEGQSRSKALEERFAGRSGAAVMRHLQDVPATRPDAQHGEQVVVAVLLEVSGQEGPLPPEAERQHDGGVVHGAPDRWRHGRQDLQWWPQHVDPRGAEAEGVALREADTRHAEAFGGRTKRPRPCAISGHAGLGDAPHAIARHECPEAAGMVLVRVREQDEVDAAVPDGDPLIEPAHEQVGVGAPIHQDPSTASGLEQDRVTLADVEDGDAQLRRRTGDEDEAEDGNERAGRAQGKQATSAL
jgi:hypothetical protein